MNIERKEKVTVRYTKAELAALDGEAKTLGMSRSEYIRTLMQHGKSRLYIEYLHSLVEQINVSMREIAEQKAAPQTAEISPAAASASPDVLQRILTGLQVLHTKMAQTEEKIEHIEGFVDARVGLFPNDMNALGLDYTKIGKDGLKTYVKRFQGAKLPYMRLP